MGSITQQMRGRAVTHEEALKSAHRLINSHFGNPDRASCCIPVQADDDDIVVIDYILEQQAKDAKIMEVLRVVTEYMMVAITIVVLMSAPRAHSQTPSWIPSHCAVGDVGDSYTGNWYICVKDDGWQKFPVLPTIGVTCASPDCVEEMNRPEMLCHLFFYDSNHIGHCPADTSSGRWVACEPCVKETASCAGWLRGCRSLIDLQRHYDTAEPTIISFSTPRENHATNRICPSDFKPHIIERYEDFGPLCIRRRVK